MFQKYLVASLGGIFASALLFIALAHARIEDRDRLPVASERLNGSAIRIEGQLTCIGEEPCRLAIRDTTNGQVLLLGGSTPALDLTRELYRTGRRAVALSGTLEGEGILSMDRAEPL